MWPFTPKARNGGQQPRDKPRATVAMRWLPISRTRADITLQGNEAIYAAVSRISNTVASMPLHLYKGWELQTDHPLEQLIAYAPNDNFTPFGFKQTMECFRNTEGAAYALILTDNLGAIKRLDILDPTRVRPLRNSATREVWYSISLDDGKAYPVPGCMLLTLRHMSTNGAHPIRPIDVLRGSLDYGKQVNELALNQLDGVNHGIMLEVPNSALGDEERTRTVNDFLDAYEKSGGRVVVLEGGLKATAFSQSPVDAQLLDVERIIRNRVATVYNLPPHILGDYTDTSFSTAEQQMQEFLQLAIMPIVAQWEEELNRKLLTPQDFKDGYRFRFDVDSLCRADVVAMANKNAAAIRGGWLRPNEVRAQEGKPPDENGNELMASRDLLPLRIAVQRPELLLGAVKQTEQPQEGGKTT